MEKKKSRLPGEERREILLDTACRLFAENGYDKTSTKQLAAEAGCSEGLIYKYFDSKKAIMDTLLAEWAAAQNQKFHIEIIDHSAISTLRDHYNTFISTSKKETIHSNLRPQLMNALNSTPYYRQKAWELFTTEKDMIHTTIVPIIEFGQKQGEIRQGNSQLLANLFVGYMVGAREISGNFPDRFKPVPFDQISDMLFNKHKDS